MAIVDRAYVGEARVNYCRCNVYMLLWDENIENLKNVDIKQIGTDPPIMGYCRMGYTYFGAQYGILQDIKEQLAGVT